MAEPEHLDVLVLGSGQAGNLIAWHMAKSGSRTALVERRWIGGSCPNIACMPSKNEVWSARIAHLVHHAGQFGTLTTPGKTDMAQVRQRKRDMVAGEVAAFRAGFKSSGAELIEGSGRFIAPKALEVQLNAGGTRILTGDTVFLNIGTHSAMPPIAGLEAAKPLTHIDILEIDYVPSHLIVLGGGYVGLEFAQAYRRFGSRVTVIESAPQIIGREDADSAEAITQILSDEGIRILTSANVVKVEGQSGRTITLTLRGAAGEERLEASDILVATGRVPNTAGIGLETAGVALDSRGYIQVNDRLETTAPDVWALGECAGSPQFTHVSVDDFRIVRDNLAGGHRSTTDRLTPSCVFTDPPLAHVGLRERDAQRQGIPVRVAKMPTGAVVRTHTTGEKLGFMKALVGEDDRILGFTMIGAEAGEVMAAVQTAMLAGLPYRKLRDAVIAHLTMAEGLGPLLENVPPRAAV
ncbi:FAD-dependent oxidoreductase [uncultured Methylovirgula sp.]|uniref:FAD-dependent oxidoreductase n=1 Tax=uncultured Methylovirgula sp. TaxID=1285960 RepID=UPI002634AB8D|nr:FAD-dependent oxidoreductase [uncultured Methylovirgula sp.]